MNSVLETGMGMKVLVVHRLVVRVDSILEAPLTRSEDSRHPVSPTASNIPVTRPQPRSRDSHAGGCRLSHPDMRLLAPQMTAVAAERLDPRLMGGKV